MKFKMSAVLPFLVSIAACVNSQTNNEYEMKLVGGPCEGCEAVFEHGDMHLNSVDTLPDFNKQGPKLKVTGIVYDEDGTTPAKDVIIYIYHTDQNGIYATKGDETGWGKRHGYLRGWIKTGEDGRYTFYTTKPGTYPNRAEPAHIHPIILEPDGKYYWLMSTFFEGDPLIKEEHRDIPNPRGGSQSVIELKRDGAFLVAERDFVLGRNIPDYD